MGVPIMRVRTLTHGSGGQGLVGVTCRDKERVKTNRV
jgi:hypothetical protein